MMILFRAWLLCVNTIIFEDKEIASYEITALTRTGKQMCECIFVWLCVSSAFWLYKFNRSILPALTVISCFHEDSEWQSVCVLSPYRAWHLAAVSVQILWPKYHKNCQAAASYTSLIHLYIPFFLFVLFSKKWWWPEDKIKFLTVCIKTMFHIDQVTAVHPKQF